MKTFFIVIAVIAVLVLIIVFRSQIGAFFSPDKNPKEGDVCTDSNGNPSTIQNGVCKEIIINPPVEETIRVILNVPETVQIIRRGACRNTIQLAQYPGYIWNLYKSSYFYCYYRRA